VLIFNLDFVCDCVRIHCILIQGAISSQKTHEPHKWYRVRVRVEVEVGVGVGVGARTGVGIRVMIRNRIRVSLGFR